MIGAMLLVTPAFASDFSYVNPGHKVYMNITNNQDGATFNINSTLSMLPIVVLGADTYFIGNISYIGGFQNYVLNYSGHCGNFTSGPCGANKTAAWNFYNTSMGYYENTTGWQDVLFEMASTYLITGTGAHDNITIAAGMLADTFSIVAPGLGTQVNITTGSGSSTYAVQVGLNGTVNIRPGLYENMSSSTIGIFNIVYDSNFY
jgi:hypothetical protein